MPKEPGIDEQKIRNTLKAKRNLLFADFSKNPVDTRLALEIRSLDDRIADLDRFRKMPDISLDSKSVLQ